MNVDRKLNREDRLKIADRIVELSSGVLSKEMSGRHIALRIGSPPNCNTVTVSNLGDRVAFFIRTADLVQKAESEGFKPERMELEEPISRRNKDRYRFRNLGLSDLHSHEALFREIVMESVNVIMDRRSQRN